MVYYVCPNCSHRSDAYEASMIHYNACDVVRVRNVSSPTNSTIGGQHGAIATQTNGGGKGGDAGGQGGSTGGQGGQDELRQGQMGVSSQPQGGTANKPQQ